MSNKMKIEVHTAFNLITPEGHTDHAFKPFGTGTHTVTEKEAAHPWVQQHSNSAEVLAKLAAPEEVEETEEVEEETSEEAETEEPVEEEDDTPRRGRRR